MLHMGPSSSKLSSSFEFREEESDGDYSNSSQGDPKKDRKNSIRIGDAYQAEIPNALCKDALNKEKLLWNPGDLSDNDIKDFLVRMRACQNSPASPKGVNKIPTGSHVPDNEQALYLLLQCGLNRDAAIRRSIHSIASTNPSRIWSEQECRNFESGFRQYEKDFHAIQQYRMRMRSVSELVQFYYLWKKTERRDLVAPKKILGKRKYFNAGEFLARFKEDSPPTLNSVSLLSGDQWQHQLTNNNTEPAGMTLRSKRICQRQ